MKNIFIVVIGCLFFMKVEAMHWAEFEGKFNCPTINNSHKCARSIERSLTLSFAQRVSESLIEITLKNDAIIMLEDQNVGSDGVRSYSVLEYYPGTEHLVIHIQKYEGGKIALFDLTNGELSEFFGYPVFTADSKYLAVGNVDLESGNSPNVIEIHEYNDRKFSLVFQQKPSDWGPKSMEWKSSRKLRFLKGTWDCAYAIKRDCESVEVNLEDNKWRIQNHKSQVGEIR